MKRHFMKSLKAFGMGVISLVAASSLVVSCYDDSALRGEISGVKEDVKNLSARLDSLENSLTSQITAVQALYTAVESLKAADDALTSKDEELASKIIIAEVKATDNGKIQVVLTDGTSVEIEPASNVKNQLVTVVDNNWALVDPVTGAVTTLKVNDATVPVSHPGFKIRFNDNTRYVEVSVDGGAPFILSRHSSYNRRARHQYYFLDELPYGEHTVTFTLDSEKPDKSSMKDYSEYKAEYDNSEFYISNILVVGDIK